MSLMTWHDRADQELETGAAIRAVASIGKMIRELCDLADLTPEVAIERAVAAASARRAA